MEAPGNIFAVADSMGHVDVQSMKPRISVLDWNLYEK